MAETFSMHCYCSGIVASNMLKHNLSPDLTPHGVRGWWSVEKGMSYIRVCIFCVSVIQCQTHYMYQSAKVEVLKFNDRCFIPTLRLNTVYCIISSCWLSFLFLLALLFVLFIFPVYFNSWVSVGTSNLFFWLFNTLYSQLLICTVLSQPYKVAYCTYFMSMTFLCHSRPLCIVIICHSVIRVLNTMWTFIEYIFSWPFFPGEEKGRCFTIEYVMPTNVQMTSESTVSVLSK